MENRHNTTPHRGRLYIHAGHKIDVAAVIALRDRGYDVPRLFPHGVILGHVDLVECTTAAPSVWAQPGYAHWVLRNPQLLDTPVAHRGLPFLHRRKEPL